MNFYKKKEIRNMYAFKKYNKPDYVYVKERINKNTKNCKKDLMD